MTVPSYAEIRKAVREAAQPMSHPTKGDYETGRLAGQPHRYGPEPKDGGPVVYFGDGAVGMRYKGKFVIAQGDDHQDSLLALARHIGFTKLDNKVKVVTVDKVDFAARCLPQG